MRSGFFNDTEVWAEDFARFAAGLLTDGVLADTNDALKPTATGNNMQVQIAPGYCWIKGHFGLIENTESVTIAMADGSLPRIDRITARLDLSSNSVHLHVITGTPAETPAPPSVVRDGTYYDIGLATVALPAGALRVTSAMITDTRSDVTVCGAVIYRNADGMALDGKADKTTVENNYTTLDNRITAINTALGNRVTSLENRSSRVISVLSEIKSGGRSGSITIPIPQKCIMARISGSVTIGSSYNVPFNDVMAMGTGDVKSFENSREYSVESYANPVTFSVTGTITISENSISVSLSGHGSAGTTTWSMTDSFVSSCIIEVYD